MEATIDEFAPEHRTDSENPARESNSTDETTEATNFFEAMLTDDESVDDMVLDDSKLTATLHRLLALAVAGLLSYGLAVGAVLEAYTAFELFPSISSTPAIWMPLTLTGGFLAAMIICLPGFYFYTQLSGVDASFRLVTAQSLRVQARTSVILLGVMPFWVAWALTPFLDLELLRNAFELPLFEPLLILLAGLGLPFLVGLFGLWSVYRSYRRLLDELPITHPRRGNFLLRMVLCWAVAMGCVTPVAMCRIGEFLVQVV